MTAYRRFESARPRCPFCGAWALWDGENLQCNNIRCNRGISNKRATGRKPICGRCPIHRMPKPTVSHVDGQTELDLEGLDQ